MNNKALAHNWAHQIKQSGKGSNLYYEGETIYSYGAHYVAAKLYGDLALVNCYRYSATTQKHLSIIRSALHIPYIEVPYPQQGYEVGNLRYLVGLIEPALSLARRAKKPWQIGRHLETAKKAHSDAVLYAKKFEIDSIMVPPLGDISDIEHHIVIAEQKAREQEKIKAEKMLTLLADKIPLWREGKINNLPIGAPTMLRLNGDVIETSHNASVPVSDALAWLPVIVAAFNCGKVLEGLSWKLGHFKLTAITEESIIVGCHTIPKNEVLSIAQQLGV